jgi:hypothetical protein
LVVRIRQSIHSETIFGKHARFFGGGVFVEHGGKVGFGKTEVEFGREGEPEGELDFWKKIVFEFRFLNQSLKCSIHIFSLMFHMIHYIRKIISNVSRYLHFLLLMLQYFIVVDAECWPTKVNVQDRIIV